MVLAQQDCQHNGGRLQLAKLQLLSGFVAYSTYSTVQVEEQAYWLVIRSYGCSKINESSECLPMRNMLTSLKDGFYRRVQRIYREPDHLMRWQSPEVQSQQNQWTLGGLREEQEAPCPRLDELLNKVCEAIGSKLSRGNKGRVICQIHWLLTGYWLTGFHLIFTDLIVSLWRAS